MNLPGLPKQAKVGLVVLVLFNLFCTLGPQVAHAPTPLPTHTPRPTFTVTSTPLPTDTPPPPTSTPSPQPAGLEDPTATATTAATDTPTPVPTDTPEPATPTAPPPPTNTAPPPTATPTPVIEQPSSPIVTPTASPTPDTPPGEYDLDDVYEEQNCADIGVYGYVRDDHENPLPDIVIEAGGEGRKIFVRTNKDGFYSVFLAPLIEKPSGKWYVQVVRQGQRVSNEKYEWRTGPDCESDDVQVVRVDWELD